MVCDCCSIPNLISLGIIRGLLYPFESLPKSYSYFSTYLSASRDQRTLTARMGDVQAVLQAGKFIAWAGVRALAQISTLEDLVRNAQTGRAWAYHFLSQGNVGDEQEVIVDMEGRYPLLNFALTHPDILLRYSVNR